MRLLVALFVLLLLSPLAVAQNQFGARLGVTAATVTGDFATADAANTRLGFVGGFYLAFPLRYDLAVQTEVLYTQKGFKTNEIEEGTSATLELITLDFPLLLKYTASLTSDFSVAPYVGPYFSYEISERLSVETPDGSFTEESNDFISTDLGFVVGLDLRLQLSDFTPSFGIRYSRSAVNLLEEESIEASPVPDATAYNSVFVFFLALRL